MAPGQEVLGMFHVFVFCSPRMDGWGTFWDVTPVGVNISVLPACQHLGASIIGERCEPNRSHVESTVEPLQRAIKCRLAGGFPKPPGAVHSQTAWIRTGSVGEQSSLILKGCRCGVSIQAASGWEPPRNMLDVLKHSIHH